MSATLREIVATRQLPAPGQLVTARDRRSVVTAAAESSTHGEHAHRQDLGALSSVEDDALRDELQVVWLIGPGARMLERTSMPELSGFDEPARPDAFLNAARRGAVSQAAATVKQAAFRRRTRALRWPSLLAVSRGRVPRAIGRSLLGAGTAGNGNPTTDAALSALAIEHGATRGYFDRDFRRFAVRAPKRQPGTRICRIARASCSRSKPALS